MYNLNLSFLTHNTKNFKILETLIKKYCQFFKLNIEKNLFQINIKTTQKNFTLLKSPHVHKKSREQFKYKNNKKYFIIKHTKITPLLYINYLIFSNQKAPFLCKSTITKI